MAAGTSTSTRSLWSLAPGPSQQSQPSPSSSSESDEYTIVRDNELGVDTLFLRVNGQPAQSRRTGEVYNRPVVSVRRNKEMMEFPFISTQFTLEDGKMVKLPVDAADIDSLSEQFSSGENFTLDDLALQPQFHSTPKARPDIQPRRKRMKLDPGRNANCDAAGKFRGVVEVPLLSIKKAAKGLTLIETNHVRVESFKAMIRGSKGIHLPVLPVMTDGSWEQENCEEASYILLGGYSIWEALMDLSSEDRYSCYRRVLVKIYEGLSPSEALQVGALFQQEQTLLIDDVPTLQAKVGMCRRLLYAMHDVDETQEPPSSVKVEWRTQAAAALGIVASARKELKPLEATFQLALYSKRCFEKLQRLFNWYEEEHGKPMKQSVFLSLQGLAEPDRFHILTKLVNGSLQLEDVKREASRLKKTSVIRSLFVQLANSASWEDCAREYPAHTKTEVLDHFIDMDFKKSIPREFVDFVSEAKAAAESGSSSFEHLQMDPVSLVVIEVESKEAVKVKRKLKILKSGTKHVAVLAEGIEVAAAWQAGLRKEGFNEIQESSIIKETHVCHLITATSEDTLVKLPRMISEDQAFSMMIQSFSKCGDSIGVDGDMEELRSTTTALGRTVRSLWRTGELSQII
nr:uncharacterized protein LOC129279468 [Lytechinus pictus]